jgi:Carbon-nitrogen hydrolase
MERAVKVACVQAEPVILDREATLDKLEKLAREAAGNGAELVVFPETFVSVYPSSRWARAFAVWDNDGAKRVFAQIAESAVAVGSPSERRLGAVAQELGIWLVTGVNEVEPEQPGTIYNALLYHSPDGELAMHHRKLVPTNHERLIWGQGDGRGLHAVETGFGRIGGLICWETTCRSRGSRCTSRAWRSTSPRLPLTKMRGRRRSCTSRARAGHTSFLRAPTSWRRRIPTTSLCAGRSKAWARSVGAAAQSSAQTGRISRDRSTTERGSSTPSSIR